MHTMHLNLPMKWLQRKANKKRSQSFFFKHTKLKESTALLVGSFFLKNQYIEKKYFEGAAI
jgi:hypothetical protein